MRAELSAWSSLKEQYQRHAQLEKIVSIPTMCCIASAHESAERRAAALVCAPGLVGIAIEPDGRCRAAGQLEL